MLGSARLFPLEVTLKTGETHIAAHPDYAYLLPDGFVYLFSEKDNCDISVNPGAIAAVRPLRRDGASTAALALLARQGPFAAGAAQLPICPPDRPRGAAQRRPMSFATAAAEPWRASSARA